jgi:hypothetical protein
MSAKPFLMNTFVSYCEFIENLSIRSRSILFIFTTLALGLYLLQIDPSLAATYLMFTMLVTFLPFFITNFDEDGFDYEDFVDKITIFYLVMIVVFDVIFILLSLFN